MLPTWRLPPLAGMMYFVENGNKMLAKAYGQAGGVATECLFSMRTIVSLGVESAPHALDPATSGLCIYAYRRLPATGCYSPGGRLIETRALSHRLVHQSLPEVAYILITS